MYKLTRISLVHWYLVSAKDIDIRDATAFIGPTGAGKSSVQDAIQTVICGGNHRHVHANASASGKSERKILDYCLGYLVPKADGGEPLRTACESILALTFTEERKDGSCHHIAVGIAMTARLGDSRETVIARFIAPGLRFSVEDCKETDEQGTLIRRWEDIEGRLKRACPGVRFYRHSAEKFVTDMLAEMRRHGRQPDARHFLHTFSNAVAFKPIFDPTVFVRSYILEPDPLDIERVRGSIARWRDLAKTVAEIEEKLKRLSGVRRRYADWGALVIGRAADQWGLACAQGERARLELRRAGADLAGARERLSHQEKVQRRQSESLTEARNELTRLRAMLAASDAQGKLAQIKAQEENAHLRLREIGRDDKAVRDALRLASNISAAKDFLPASARAVVAAAQAALSLLDGEPGLGWLSHHLGAVGESLAKLKALEDLPQRLQPQIEDRQAQLIELRKRRDAAEENLRRVASGTSPLSDHTTAFIRLLREAGIDATPLCDVVEVADESWQFAAESLLGLYREALIVDPERVGEANEILFRNRNRSGLHLCRLIKTTRTREVDAKPAPDSLATVFRTDNPHALALVCNHLASVRMVETVADLERASRAIMRDGRATSGLTYSVNRDITLIIGRRARLASSEALRSEAAQLKEEIARLDREVALISQAARVAEQLSGQTIDLDSAAFQYEEIRRQLAELRKRRETMLSEDDARLESEIGDLEGEIREREQELEEIKEEWKQAVQAEANARADAENARTTLRRAVREKRLALKRFADEALAVALHEADAESRAAFRGTENPYLGQRLKFASDAAGATGFYDERMKEHLTALRDIDDRISRTGGSARAALDAYLREYGIQRPFSDEQPYTFDYQWVVRQHAKLEQNELRDYRTQAEAAEREMYFTLKEDLLVNLNGKFQKLDIQLKTLNRQLGRRKFTGQFYKFGRKPDPRFDRIRRLAVEVGDNPEQAQAIMERRTGDLVLQAAMDELNEYLDNTGGEGLEDYRNYFTFDLYMSSAQGADDEVLEVNAEEARKRGLITLSARATVGSGGEGQAPFYVAIAASMALAYYPGGQPTGAPSGMGLVLFDEAFNKLDITTTQSLIRFFKDLGLQLILAAPEDKRPTFTEVLDCIVSVNKDAVNQVVHLDSEFPTLYAREQLAAINPDHVGVEGFRARLQELADAD